MGRATELPAGQFTALKLGEKSAHRTLSRGCLVLRCAGRGRTHSIKGPAGSCAPWVKREEDEGRIPAGTLKSGNVIAAPEFDAHKMERLIAYWTARVPFVSGSQLWLALAHVSQSDASLVSSHVRKSTRSLGQLPGLLSEVHNPSTEGLAEVVKRLHEPATAQ